MDDLLRDIDPDAYCPPTLSDVRDLFGAMVAYSGPFGNVTTADVLAGLARQYATTPPTVRAMDGDPDAWRHAYGDDDDA